MTNYYEIPLDELRIMARKADRAVKDCNVKHCDMRTNMWKDPEYMRLLAIADEIDRVVDERSKQK
jgi:hypothetical protein